VMVACVQTGSKSTISPGVAAAEETGVEPELAVVPTPELAAPTSLVSSPETQVA
jgi:hypothetical protein